MGREAHLARSALGRSAFQEPLRDANSEFVLGDQARRFDDLSYTQAWDERGYPQNSSSDRQNKRFCKAQNEVLQACGVIVRKDAEKKRKRKGKEIPESVQLDVAKEENEIGFVLKYIDNVNGDLLTWWISNIKKRLMVSKPLRPTAFGSIRAEFTANPVSFLFGGLGLSATAVILSAWQYPGFIEQAKYADFLGLRDNDHPATWWDKFHAWGKRLFNVLVEMPLAMMSSLQRLGFRVTPIILASSRILITHRTHSSGRLIDPYLIPDFARLVLLHLVRSQVREEVLWRLYMLTRQLLPRPKRPSTTCIVAAETDEYESGESIIGIGRSLGHCTDRRFYGPQSFWPALKAAFPWINTLTGSTFDIEEIKKETLERCAMMEAGQDNENLPEHQFLARRTENIISNLESLGVDLEEDFFVDVDAWSDEIDLVDRDTLFGDTSHFSMEDIVNVEGDEENEANSPNLNIPTSNRTATDQPALESTYSIMQNDDGSIMIEFGIERETTSTSNQQQSENMESLATSVHPRVPISQAPSSDSAIVLSDPPRAQFQEDLGELDDIAAQTRLANHISGEISEPASPVTNAATQRHGHLEWGVPLTPEPGIRRAGSLSQTQTTPRPIRRTTETENDINEETYLAEVLNGARKVEARKKARENHESRVTRLSVFAAESFAWHASSIITGLMLLPLDAIYYRRLTQYFTSFVSASGVKMSTRFMGEEIQLAESIYTGRQSRMLLLSIGLECLMHGAIWQAGCSVARYYGRQFRWGKF